MGVFQAAFRRNLWGVELEYEVPKPERLLEKGNRANSGDKAQRVWIGCDIWLDEG